MEKKKYRRLTYQERIIIETLLNQGKTKANIAEKIKRTRSTIAVRLINGAINPDLMMALSHIGVPPMTMKKRGIKTRYQPIQS